MNAQTDTNKISQQNTKRTIAWLTVVFIILLVVSIVATALITFSFTVNTFFPEPEEQLADIEILESAIKDSAYYPLDYEHMQEAALKAYVEASGDKYAVYYTDEEYARIRAENAGHYVGIGVVVREKQVVYEKREITVLEVIRISKDSPAEEGHISVGDCIYAVHTDDGIQYVNDIGMDQTTGLIRGESESVVMLSCLYETDTGYELKQVELTRRAVESVSVDYNVSEAASNVGVIRIYQFDLTTPTQLSASFDALISMGIEKFVLDLRDNGGGDLWSVVACASYFVKSGDIILSEENKDGAVEQIRAVIRSYPDEYASCSVSSEDIGKYGKYEFVTLVNENTASAAELFTAVLRDYDLAYVVGVQTFGKGSVQSYISLASRGMKGVLKVTTNHYFPPCGEGYHEVGIAPDLKVELMDGVKIHATSEDEDNQLLCAIAMLAVPGAKPAGNN